MKYTSMHIILMLPLVPLLPNADGAVSQPQSNTHPATTTSAPKRQELDLSLIADMMIQYSFVTSSQAGKEHTELEANCFTGKEAVSWMLASLPGLVDTRCACVGG